MLEGSEITVASPDSSKDGLNQAGPSKLCSICREHSSVYTCPGCSTRTCSLPCSTSHKQKTGCSGQRNKAAYLPMNQYGYGALMNDYVYLEEVGRKVGDWGKDIIRDKLVDPSILSVRGSGRGMPMRGRGRGRGGRGGRTHVGKAVAKRETLKRQLDLWDIDVDLLPAGMAKAQLNKSHWDFKTKTALLTVEFRLHAPPPLPGRPPEASPYVLLTHHNSFSTSLSIMLQQKVSKRPNSKTDPSIPAWIHTLVAPDPDDPEGFVPPLYLMRAKTDLVAPTPMRLPQRPEISYWQLKCNKKLSELLRHKTFVEFPTVDIWPQGEFHGTIVDVGGAVERVFEEQPRPKRRKIDVQAGKKAIKGLIGEYGSDSDDADAENVESVLGALGGYTGSDDEQANTTPVGEDAGKKGVNARFEEEEVDYRAVLDGLNASQQESILVEDEDDEVVDWEDSEPES